MSLVVTKSKPKIPTTLISDHQKTQHCPFSDLQPAIYLGILQIVVNLCDWHGPHCSSFAVEIFVKI